MSKKETRHLNDVAQMGVQHKTHKYSLEIEVQSELDQEQKDDLLCRLGAQFEGGEFGLYWKYKLVDKGPESE
jgi:hypothetical protein